jgi:hypothetical protein
LVVLSRCSLGMPVVHAILHLICQPRKLVEKNKQPIVK